MTENGECKATKALILGLIPGWYYDNKKKLAYRPDQSKLKIQLDFDECILERELSTTHRRIEELQLNLRDYLEQGEMKLFLAGIYRIKAIVSQ